MHCRTLSPSAFVAKAAALALKVDVTVKAIQLLSFVASAHVGLRRPARDVVTREVALSVLDKCRMPRGTAVDAKNMYELSIILFIDLSKLGLLWLLWRGLQPVAAAT